MSQEVTGQVRPFMPVYCDQDELLRCEHGFPVELAPCPKCGQFHAPPGSLVQPSAYCPVPTVTTNGVVTGWACPGCGADNNHFEFCRNCHRPQP